MDPAGTKSILEPHESNPSSLGTSSCSLPSGLTNVWSSYASQTHSPVASSHRPGTSPAAPDTAEHTVATLSVP